MVTVYPFTLNYSIPWMCMEVSCDEDGGLLRLLSTSVLQLLVFEGFCTEQRSYHHSLVVNCK